MDTTDVEITFDAAGVCNHCLEFDRVTRLQWLPDERGALAWSELVGNIRREGSDKEYDCILGLSGGIDSSYLALKALDAGLRPLVVHVDAGWNSELAVSNIEKIVKYCKFDLHTHVVDWEEMRDLHLSYLRAGVANQDVPQDHAFFATLYKFATDNGIRYVLNGGNIATEGIFPSSWHASAMDAINLRAIHKRFGERPLKHYITVSFFRYYISLPFIYRMRSVRPLNLMPFNKELALRELEQRVGFRGYQRKHGESLFTKIFQNYYLPEKFGLDKRKPHLSSLIKSGQMSREQALIELEKPLYHPDELQVDINYFCKKLRISKEQFSEYLAATPHDYADFPTWDRRYKLLKAAQALVARITGRRINAYS